jgi:hypothetical protein
LAIDYVDVVQIKKSLDDEYQEYHRKFRRLRDIYHGRYWQVAENDAQARSISSIFRDLGRANRTSLPPIRIVRNIIQEVCVKYQTFLSPVPMVNYYTDAPEDFTRREQMTMKERYTYGIWRAGKMSARLNNVAWYQPLMGDAFIGIWPDMKRSIPVPIIRSPEHAYPLKGFGDEINGHIFHWQEKYSAIKRAFPEYADRIYGNLGRVRAGKGSDPMCDIYEYSDEHEVARWVQGVKVNGVEHDFGFDFFAHSKFIDVPDETFGHSAVEQAVNLNEADNMITSLLFQAMLENIFPTIVLTDPAKAPEELMKGPGAIIPLNPGGKFDVIAPPVQAVATQLEYLAQNKQAIQEVTGMPAVNFGTSPASSIVTGAAVNELQGAGTGSTVQMVQGGLGLIISQWCEKAILMQRRMWESKEITLNYVTPMTRAGGDLSKGSMTVKGSDLEGGTANEIVWSPSMDIHDKIVMWLQAKGAGLVSDEFILKQIGIPDPEAMTESITSEELQRAMLGFIVNQLAQGPQQDVSQAEEAANALVEGKPRKVPIPPPSPGVPAAPASAGGPPSLGGGNGGPPGPPPGPGGPAGPAGGPPPGGPIPLSGGDLTGPFAGGQGAVKSPPLTEPPGAPVPPGSKAAAAMAATTLPPGLSTPTQTPATVNSVVRALSGGNYKGRVWLVGEIVVKGAVSGAVDVALTNPADKETVKAQAPQYQFHFVVVKGQPAEKSIEVTGGGQPVGQEQPQ